MRLEISTGQIPEHIKEKVAKSARAASLLENVKDEGSIIETRAAEIIDIGDGCYLLIWADTGHWAVIC